MILHVDPAVVRENFARFTDNPSLQESAQLFAAGRPVLEMIQALAMNPRVLRAFAGLVAVYPGGSLERSLVEKVILCVSELHDCQFCVNSHRDIMSRLDIDTNLSADSGLSSRERLAVDYARLVTLDSNHVTEACFIGLRREFSEPELVELTFVIGFITMLNRFNNALGIRYHGELRDLRVS
jgi:alkylhydroperoxidase family enzyme